MCCILPITFAAFPQVLVGIAGQLGGIEPLFDTLFSFLYRKTDYFHVMKPGDKIGFPPGRAQQLLLGSFGKFERLAAETARRAAEEALAPRAHTARGLRKRGVGHAQAGPAAVGVGGEPVMATAGALLGHDCRR